MQSPEMKAKKSEYIMTVMNGFLCITIDYLSRIKGWDKEQLEEFLVFAQDQLHYVEEYEDYFVNMLKELEDETGVKVDVRWG